MPGWEIALVTSKSSNGGLYTTLSAAIIDGGFRYFRMYKDYMNTIRRDPQMRATAKNLRALHDSALAECTPEKLASIPVPDPR
jgi:hypothetical protein